MDKFRNELKNTYIRFNIMLIDYHYLMMRILYNKRLFLFTLFFLVSILIQKLYGTMEPHLVFEKITTQDGLPHNITRCIIQDSRGFMWFGTDNGLARYDGISIKNYTLGIPDSSGQLGKVIRCIYEDYEGILWIGTNSGLCAYDPEKDSLQCFFYNEADENSLFNQAIFDIVADEDHDIWVATGNGISIYKRAEKLFYNYLFDKDEHYYGTYFKKVCKLLIDKDKSIWLATNYSKLIKFDKNLGVIESFTLKNLDPNHPEIQFTSIFDMVQQDSITYWLATSDGIVRFDYNKHEFKYFYPSAADPQNSIAGKAVQQLVIDNQNQLWAATRSGLSCYDLGTGKFKNYYNNPFDYSSLSENSIAEVYFDAMGILWLGTYQGGINKLLLNRKEFFTYSFIPNSNSITEKKVLSICQDKEGVLWLGSNNGVLQKISFDNVLLESKKIFPEDRIATRDITINKIIEDKYQNLWLCSGTLWLLKIDKKTGKVEYFRRFEDKPDGLGMYSMQDIHIDKNNNLWIASNDYGLDLLPMSLYENQELKLSNVKFFHYRHDENNPESLASNYLRSVVSTNDGIIWIGTADKGLDRLDPKTNTFTHFKNIRNNNSSLMNNIINTLYIAPSTCDSIIWIGTMSGLDKFNYIKNTFTHYTVSDGLAGDFVLGIVDDNQGNLWISTNSGLSKFYPEQAKFENYYETDGLQGNEFIRNSCFRNELTGELFFGGTQGFTRFFPEDISMDTTKPVIKLSSLAIMGREVEVNQVINGEVILKKTIESVNKITLSYKNNDLTIGFAALHYISPKENRYKYMLENFDVIWKKTTASNNKATYTNLPPGEYTFLVYGSNSDNEWSVQPARLEIVILPPFWKTWLFRILAILIIIVVTVVLFYLRTQSLISQKLQLEQKVQERTRQLEDANAFLEEKQEEINNQNEELMVQKDALLSANHKLTEQQNQILLQNQELDLHRHKLEKLVKERTTELDMARIKAEESDRLKSAFLANMSHEIRTPMNAIVGFTSLLNDDGYKDDEKQDFVNIIIKNSETLLTLINDIIDLSKIQAQQIEINISYFLLEDFFIDIFDNFRLTSTQKGLDLRCDFRNPLNKTIIYSDQIRLKQIFSNLISNAIKFSNQGYIEYGIQNVDENKITFYVKDTGIGISNEYRNLIFDRFSKINPDERSYYGGAGLGLAIVKDLVGILGGSIWFESSEGEGTIFYFDHALTKPEHLPPDINELGTLETVQKNTGTDLSKIQIIIAEDEEMNFKLLESYLKNTKAKITWAKHGKEVMEYLHSGLKPDLILMDIKMPVMDGYTATKYIKDEFRDIIIVAQTAFARPEEYRDFIKGGFDRYLIKPIKKEHLLDTILDLLNKQPDPKT